MLRHLRFIYLFIICAIVFSFVLLPEMAKAAPVAVINGSAVAEGEQPWMVGILQAAVKDDYLAQFCGGSLIHAEWVLTAAHCTFSEQQRPFKPNELAVLVGRRQLTSNEGERIQIDRVIRHRAFVVANYQNDIALLHLSKPVDLPTIVLTGADGEHPPALLETPSTVATVLGWGVTADGDGADTLQQANLPIVSTSACQAYYTALGFNLYPGMLCAGYAKGGTDACAGDSGGPLLVFDQSINLWIQIGIISWGASCAEPGAFGVYTQLSQYVDWIEAITSANGKAALSRPTPSR